MTPHAVYKYHFFELYYILAEGIRISKFCWSYTNSSTVSVKTSA